MKALFAGTFDPFTIGHKDIIKRALPLFDKIIIGVGENLKKTTHWSIEERVKAIKDEFKNIEKIEVKPYIGLTVDFAKVEKVDVLLRGVRNVADFEIEKNLAEINRNLNGMETFILISDPSLSMVSSSMIRELIFFGQDINKYLGAHYDNGI